MAFVLLKFAIYTSSALIALYASLLGLLTISWFQAHVVYLHRIQMTWFKDLNTPEQFGFLHNQVTPFSIDTPNGDALYAWHILPVELYRQHESALVAEQYGFVSDIRSRFAFALLRDDPHARLVIHFHGAAGTVASGYRIPNYRALSAGQPEKIHVLTFDYRAFGHSKGRPSEIGLISDAIAVVEWAMKVVGIPQSRIVIFGQSLGTAVSLAILEHYAVQSMPITFAGTVLVAPFIDVPTLVATYRIGGTIPILSPLARVPSLFKYLSSFIQDQWPSKDRIARYIRTNAVNNVGYKLTLIHAKDDYDIPSYHTQVLSEHAVNATFPNGISHEDFEAMRSKSLHDLGSAGTVMEWRAENSVIREEILNHGLHDVIMGSPVITMAVMRILEPGILQTGW